MKRMTIRFLANRGRGIDQQCVAKFIDPAGRYLDRVENHKLAHFGLLGRAINGLEPDQIFAQHPPRVGRRLIPDAWFPVVVHAIHIGKIFDRTAQR